MPGGFLNCWYLLPLSSIAIWAMSPIVVGPETVSAPGLGVAVGLGEPEGVGDAVGVGAPLGKVNDVSYKLLSRLEITSAGIPGLGSDEVMPVTNTLSTLVAVAWLTLGTL